MSIDSAGSTTAEHAVSVDSVPASASSSLPSSTPLTTEGGSTAAMPLAAVSSTVVSAIVDSVKALISSSTTTTTTTTSTSSPTTTPFASTFSTKSSSSSSSSSSTSPLHEKIDVADLSSSLQHFGIVDYCVFILMLVVCAVIGFYFGFIEKKKKSAKKEATIDNAERRGSEALDYLVGGRKMKVFPVSLSLVASFVSGVSLLGTSTEIYVYGTQYAFILITLALSGLISWYIFLPVFCNLQLTSTYEYFERRFDRRIRIFGSFLFIALSVLWMPICIYVPALTLNQVSGINVHVIVPVVCVICTIYTTIGGIKGVVWTDVIQGIVMVGSMLLVIIKGTIDVGGLGIVWERNMASGHLVAPDMTFDPTVRMGIFAVLVGGAAYKLQANCINQTAVQRFLTLPDMKSVKKALIFSMIGFLFVMGLCVYIGLLAFAEYYDCDPITTGLARAKDQVIPLYVMQIASVYPGVVGLFVAGVFSAALSTLSTVLNSLSAVVLKDFVEVFRKQPLTERQTGYVMRGVVLMFGLFSMLGVHVVERLGMVMQLSASIGAITCGPLLGAFSVGMLLPFVNTKSLLAGISVASAFTSYIVLRAQVALATGDMTFPGKPVSVEGCTYGFELPANSTMHEEPTSKSLHHISFLWYTFIGSAGTILCSLIATLCFGKQDPLDVAPELLAECVRSYWHPNYSKVATEETPEKLKLELIDRNCDVNDTKANQAYGDE